MVVISIALLSKTGEILLARQFVEISKVRLEGYLNSFPKLVPPPGGQHTVIDTEHIRFLYQSINQSINQSASQYDPSMNQALANNQGIWVVLITNKQSNIMEDLDTLQSVIKLLPEYCSINQSINQSINLSIEQSIKQSVFELIFALDELVNQGGSKDNQSINQIKVFTAMESHEEKLQLIIQQSKMNEAKVEASRKAESIERSREAQKRLAQSGERDGRSFGSSSNYDNESDYRQTTQSISQPIEKPTPSISQSNNQSSNQPIKKGMQLGKAKAGDSFFDQLNKEEKLAPVLRESTNQSLNQSNQSAAQAASQYGVTVMARERLTTEVDSDGSYQNVVINGDMKCCVYDPNDSKIQIFTNQSNVDQSMEQLGYKLQLHPKMDKKLWASQKILTLADQSKGLPIGSDSAPVILKWRKKGEDSDVPFSINFWMNQEADNMAVNVEYTFNEELTNQSIQIENVFVRIPCEGTPDVTQIAGEFKHDPRGKTLTWIIPVINADNNSGSLDFTCSHCDYPINVDFTADQLLSGLVVENIVDTADNDRQVKFNVQHKLEVEKYVIGG